VLVSSLLSAPALAQGGGRYGSFRESRIEIDAAITARLQDRMKSLGYDRWLDLQGLYKGGEYDDGAKALVDVRYRNGDSNHLPREPRVDPYIAKVALVAAGLLGMDPGDVKVSMRNIGCHDDFRNGWFVKMGGCGGRHVGEGAPITGLTNNVLGLMPQGASNATIAGRVDRYLKDLGATTKVKVRPEGFLITATGLKDAVLKGSGRSEAVTLYLFRSVGFVSGSSDGPMNISYTDKYSLIADGSHLAMPEKGSGTPFEPEHHKQLEDFVRRVAERIQSTPAGRR
jgi:hypothetical protein